MRACTSLKGKGAQDLLHFSQDKIVDTRLSSYLALAPISNQFHLISGVTLAPLPLIGDPRSTPALAYITNNCNA